MVGFDLNIVKEQIINNLKSSFGYILKQSSIFRKKSMNEVEKCDENSIRKSERLTFFKNCKVLLDRQSLASKFCWSMFNVTEIDLEFIPDLFAKKRRF